MIILRFRLPSSQLVEPLFFLENKCRYRNKCGGGDPHKAFKTFPQMMHKRSTVLNLVYASSLPTSK